MRTKNRTLPSWAIRAIVGFWRSGAKEEMIAEAVGISLVRVINQLHIYRHENNIDPAWGSSIGRVWIEESGPISDEAMRDLDKQILAGTSRVLLFKGRPLDDWKLILSSKNKQQ